MIFDTLASMADDANDRIKNFNSTPQQAKDVLVDVDNEGLKTVIDFATKGGVCNIDNETLTVGGRTIVNNKLNELKHVIVGMQQKHPLKVIQDNQNSSSSSSSSPSPFVPSLSCAGGTEPSMVVSVVGASGTINWLGKTWNLPDDSGLQQEVCPTTYTYLSTTSTPWIYRHQEWRNVQNPGTDTLGLNRYVDVNTGASSTMTHWTNVRMRGGTIQKQDFRRAVSWAGTQQSYTLISDLGLIGTVPLATVSNFALPDAFFGSYTQGGVTFTWSRGTNW